MHKYNNLILSSSINFNSKTNLNYNIDNIIFNNIYDLDLLISYSILHDYIFQYDKVLFINDMFNKIIIKNLIIFNFNYFSNLKVLKLDKNRNITDNSINKLYNLEELSLPRNKLITSKGILNLNKLKYLNLYSNNNIDDYSISNKLLLNTIIIVHNNKITDKAFLKMKYLKYINLYYNNNKLLKYQFILNNPLIESIKIPYIIKNTLDSKIISKINKINNN